MSGTRRRVPGEIETALDRLFVRLATRLGARPIDPPYPIREEFLDRVEFFASFPRRAVPAGRDGTFLPPATCYRMFQALVGTDLLAPVAVTLTGPCFRRETRYGPGRLRAFTMRELVFVTDEEGVAGARNAAAAASKRLARTLGLDARLQEAGDPFFAEATRAKRLLQRLLRLKLELVAPLASVPMALASFNLHQDFFGSRLGIAVGNSVAWSGCAAWGVERWRLALEERWGNRPEGWPEAVRRVLRLRD